MDRKTLIVLCIFAAMIALFLLVSCGPPQTKRPVPDFFVERPLPPGPAVIIPDETGGMPIVRNEEE